MSQLGQRVFFSFSRLLDQSKHQAYGAWHGLDHLPENIALDGVALGSRWVRTPACAAKTSAAGDELAGVQYLTTYWFREPHEQSISEWNDLASMSRHWGRRPELEWTKRLRRGYFVPTKGYVDPAALVSADVLPFRPTRGIHLSVSLFEGKPVDVVEAMRWYDEVRIPDLVSCRGAAGAWSFVSEDTFAQDRTSPQMSSLRVVLTYLDGDPTAFVDDVQERTAGWQSAGRLMDTSPVEEILLSSPLETVVPWQWDWFDGESASARENT